jgi:hypothetical protein
LEASHAAAILSDMEETIAGVALLGSDASKEGLRAATI